jgi:hypothetical protein
MQLLKNHAYHQHTLFYVPCVINATMEIILITYSLLLYFLHYTAPISLFAFSYFALPLIFTPLQFASSCNSFYDRTECLHVLYYSLLNDPLWHLTLTIFNLPSLYCKLNLIETFGLIRAENLVKILKRGPVIRYFYYNFLLVVRYDIFTTFF